MIEVHIAILAAGQGKRMECTKQLELFEDETLLARSVRTATESKLGLVFVVLGYQQEELARQIDKDVTIVANENWQEGIASSIRVAVNAVNNLPCRALLFMTIDQPLVDSKLLKSLAMAFEETSKPVVASMYGTPGIPALFAREMFPSLLELTGDKGAKQLIMKSDSHFVEAPLAQFDIDTKSDLESCRAIDRENFFRSETFEERESVTLH